MCWWFQRCVVMKVDGCGWKGCSLPRCQVPFFHLNSISHSAHVDRAYCWLLILASIAQKIALQSFHIPSHIPLRLITSALIHPFATHKWTTVLSVSQDISSEWCDVMRSILVWRSRLLMKMLMLWPDCASQTYFYDNALIHMPFLIFPYSKSIKEHVPTAFPTRQRMLEICTACMHTLNSAFIEMTL